MFILYENKRNVEIKIVLEKKICLKINVIIDYFIIKIFQINDVIFISAKLSINTSHLHWSK